MLETLRSAAETEALVLTRLDEQTPAGSEYTVPPGALQAEIAAAADDVVMQAERVTLFPLAAEIGDLVPVLWPAPVVAGAYPRFARVALPSDLRRVLSVRLASWSVPVTEDRLVRDEASLAASMLRGLPATLPGPPPDYDAGAPTSSHPAAVLVPYQSADNAAADVLREAAESFAAGGYALDLYGLAPADYDAALATPSATFALDLRVVRKTPAHVLPDALHDAAAYRAAARIAGTYLREPAVAETMQALYAGAMDTAAAFASRLATRPAPRPTFTRRLRPFG